MNPPASRWSVLLLLFGLVPACSPTGPGTEGYDDATILARDVAVENLMPCVRRLAEVRRNDGFVNNGGIPPQDLFPTDHLTRDSALALVASAFVSMGYTPDTLILGTGPQAAHTIIAEWRGDERPGEVILVGAHFDAFYAGADDNGSAVAAMLETARAVRKHRFARTIRFVAFDLEEFYALGSTRYVQAGYADDVVLAIVLDMVGYASSEPGSQQNIVGIRFPDVGDYLIVAGNERSSDAVQRITMLGNTTGTAKVVGTIAPGDGTYFLSSVFMRSDHGLFWYRGIPAVFFTDGANFRNPNYHKPSDVPETLDADFLGKNARLLAAATALFAEIRQ